MTTRVEAVTRVRIEELLFEDAALLDGFEMEKWFAGLAPNATYRVTTADMANADPRAALTLVDDDAVRLEHRARQLTGRFLWAENPRSYTRRLVGNVRLLNRHGDLLEVAANFMIHRSRLERNDLYVGEYRLVIAVAEDGTPRIRDRHVVLSSDALRPQGKLAIIL